MALEAPICQGARLPTTLSFQYGTSWVILVACTELTTHLLLMSRGLEEWEAHESIFCSESRRLCTSQDCASLLLPTHVTSDK